MSDSRETETAGEDEMTPEQADSAESGDTGRGCLGQ